MTQTEKQLTEKESLDLIAMMINKAKDSYHNTGIGSMMWGTIIAVCSLVKLAELHFDYALPFDIYWLTILAVVPQIFITLKEKKERKVKSYDDIYMDYLWLGFGISIFLLIFITNAVFSVWEPVAIEYKQLTGHISTFRFSEFIAPLFLLLYGIPTFVTGAACKFKPMLWGGLLCWVCCIISLYTTIKIDLMLTAFSAIFAWLIPGIIMERQYRKAKRGLAQAHV
ncbi:MAG: hypothetical protein WAT34_06440 [Chitinophagaceae bacterium]